MRDTSQRRAAEEDLYTWLHASAVARGGACRGKFTYTVGHHLFRYANLGGDAIIAAMEDLLNIGLQHLRH